VLKKIKELIFIRNQAHNSTIQRKSNPNMTRFKAMIMDEKVDIIDHSNQEALRVRE